MRLTCLFGAAVLSVGAFAQTPADKTISGTNERPAGWGDTLVIQYPSTKATFYGSAIDTSHDWNICIGDTDGGIEVQMVQNIVPIQHRPGEYAVVRVYTLPDGTVVKRQIKRLSNGSVPL